MRAGRLRHRVTIQQPTEGAPNSYGETANTWSTLATVWALVQTMSGREGYYAAQVQPDASVQITMRYREDVTTDMRVSYDSRYFNILSVIPDPKNTQLVLACAEAV